MTPEDIPPPSVFHVNKYDGIAVWLFGMRYQASPHDPNDHPGKPDRSVYSRSYSRVVKKALRKFTPLDEPVGTLTGNRSDGVGRQIALATFSVSVKRA